MTRAPLNDIECDLLDETPTATDAPTDAAGGPPSDPSDAGAPARVECVDLVAFLKWRNLPIPLALQAAARRRVLVVDDDIGQLHAMLRVVRPYGDQVEVEAFSNMAEGLVRAGAWMPHVIIMDASMPVISGVEACRRLRAHVATATVTAVLVSGRMTPELELQGRDAGASRVLPKPLDVATLLGLVLPLGARTP